MAARALMVVRTWALGRRLVGIACLLGFFSLLDGPVRGQQSTLAPGDDPLDLARWAAELGPRDVLALVGTDHSALVRLRAVRALPSLPGHEYSLQALLPLLEGRDPDLAPAAARSALMIATSVTASLGLRGEVDRTVLRECQRAYQEAADRGELRPDLALMAMQVAAQLAEVTATVPD